MKDYPINFSEIKRQIKIEDIVRHFQLKYKQTKDWQINMDCPLKNHPGDRNSKSFAINTDKQIYVCNTGCEPSSGVGCLDFYCDFMGYDRKTDIYKAAKELQENFNCNGFESNNKKQSYSLPVKEKEYNPVFERTLHLQSHVDYLQKEKNISPETLKYFKSGLCKYGYFKDCIAVRVFNTIGQPIGYIGQEKNGVWKFRIKKRYEIYNYHRVHQNIRIPGKKSPVIITEGPYQTMYLHQLGYRNTVAIFGISTSSEQIKLLKQLSESFILFLDNDEAGQRGTKEIFSKLKGLNIFSVDYSEFQSKKKPNDFTKEELSFLLKIEEEQSK